MSNCEAERVLFILKIRPGYAASPSYSEGRSYSEGLYAGNYFSSGLYWSTRFVVDMLLIAGIQAKLVEVVDNNDISREVANFKPTTVIIEALWVVPQKFDELKRIHPTVNWVVLLHSNTPFLSQEGIAVQWIKEYALRGIKIGVNQSRAFDDVREILRDSGLENLVVYLPDYYPVTPKTVAEVEPVSEYIHIACYGAVRPLKNHLIQAIAAMRFAEQIGKILVFHINSDISYAEMGESALSNIRALFKDTPHILSEDGWMTRNDFMEQLRWIDIGMQVSLSETFSIVTADMVNVGIPIVVSPEIGWASFLSKVDPTDSQTITEGLGYAQILGGFGVHLNRKHLKNFSKESRKVWLKFLGCHRAQ